MCKARHFHFMAGLVVVVVVRSGGSGRGQQRRVHQPLPSSGNDQSRAKRQRGQWTTPAMGDVRRHAGTLNSGSIAAVHFVIKLRHPPLPCRRHHLLVVHKSSPGIRRSQHETTRQCRSFERARAPASSSPPVTPHPERAELIKSFFETEPSENPAAATICRGMSRDDNDDDDEGRTLSRARTRVA